MPLPKACHFPRNCALGNRLDEDSRDPHQIRQAHAFCHRFGRIGHLLCQRTAGLVIFDAEGQRQILGHRQTPEDVLLEVVRIDEAAGKGRPAAIRSQHGPGGRKSVILPSRR